MTMETGLVPLAQTVEGVKQFKARDQYGFPQIKTETYLCWSI
jgi:hypothetical protein